MRKMGVTPAHCMAEIWPFMSFSTKTSASDFFLAADFFLVAGFAASRGLLGVAEAGVLQTIYFQLSLFVRVPPRPGRRRRPPRAAPGP